MNIQISQDLGWIYKAGGQIVWEGEQIEKPWLWNLEQYANKWFNKILLMYHIKRSILQEVLRDVYKSFARPGGALVYKKIKI